MTSGPSTPRANRNRRKVELTLSDEAHDKLAMLSERDGVPRSRVVERLLLEAM